MCELNLIVFAMMVSALKPVYVGRFCHSRAGRAPVSVGEAGGGTQLRPANRAGRPAAPAGEASGGEQLLWPASCSPGAIGRSTGAGPRPRHTQHARRRRCFSEEGGVKRALSLPLTFQTESD